MALSSILLDNLSAFVKFALNLSLDSFAVLRYSFCLEILVDKSAVETIGAGEICFLFGAAQLKIEKLKIININFIKLPCCRRASYPAVKIYSVSSVNINKISVGGELSRISRGRAR